MEKKLVQDYIQTCIRLSREDFCREVSAPILIGEERRADLSFSWGHTALKSQQRKTPLPREFFDQCHRLPVVELRQRHPGPRGQVRIGRTRENDIVIGDPSVSSRHAVIQQDEQGAVFALQDLASMNGTHVNGSRLVVGNAVTLFDGDVVGFGDIMFVFFYPAGLYDVLKANLESM